MLTNEDIQKIIEVVATKEDVKELKEDMSALREMTQSLVISVDKLVKALDDLRTEYASIISQNNRHEKWISQIAQKVGIKLEY
ncbi:MAG: hypothetical protein A2W71_01485 [Candidatus Nealsonbacteria bacterium RIFCSPLOWO2_02_39_8]|uniref:Uncharacterized protein n=1 Tax=Candidatus Nealsonbacteria bacterium RIFCSPLOWO2_02_39_8 TaxID=1801674 RepID=A0A1G2EJ50_9BACT|nr:MAG: hypothetical protein A2W71_01485 [Candidatus Nealsonbacteria bacterium RIFCSPLOWO2_02_39_8]